MGGGFAVNRVCIPLPDGRWLALDHETFAAALAAGAEIMAGSSPSPALAASEPLLDADQAAAQLNVTARWLEDSARAGIIPHVKLGRFIRFKVSEIAAHCRVEGAPIPGSTDSQSVGHPRLIALQNGGRGRRRWP
jgi:excisionase family DNA binding protein